MHSFSLSLSLVAFLCYKVFLATYPPTLAASLMLLALFCVVFLSRLLSVSLVIQYVLMISCLVYSYPCA